MEAPKQKTITTKGASVAGGSLPAAGNGQHVKPVELYKQHYKKNKGALSGVQSECNGIDMVKGVLPQVAFYVKSEVIGIGTMHGYSCQHGTLNGACAGFANPIVKFSKPLIQILETFLGPKLSS